MATTHSAMTQTAKLTKHINSLNYVANLERKLRELDAETWELKWHPYLREALIENAEADDWAMERYYEI